MLKGGKMGRLRRVFEVILGCNVINRHFSDVICRIFATIRGLRPANLECVTPVDDNLERVIEHKKKTTIIFKGLDGVRQYAVLFEQCVQSSTRVRKVQVVTRQTKHIRNLLPQCASDAMGFLSDVYKKSTRARKFLADGVQCGRSMIEMLGVLAIIAVLSVGGIAGYGKAMRIWNSNQQKEQMTQILHSLIRLRYELGREKNSASTTLIMPVLKAIDEIPAGLTFGGNELMDKNGNRYYASYGQSCWQIKQDSEEKACNFKYFLRISLVKTDSSLVPSSEDACANFINIAKENVKDVNVIITFWGNPKDDDNPNHWRGYEQKDAFTQTTLKTASPLQISNVCKECKNHSYCRVTLYLKTS